MKKILSVFILVLTLTFVSGCDMFAKMPELKVSEDDEAKVTQVLETNIQPVDIKDKINQISEREILNANNNIQETINSKDVVCQDGNSFIINENGNQQKVRLLLTTVANKDDADRLGASAAELVCKLIKSRNNIILIKDKNANNVSIFNEKLRWVLVDDKLVQQELANDGLLIGLYDSSTGKTSTRNNSDKNTHYYNDVINNIQDVYAIFGN